MEREQATKYILGLLSLMIERKSSDLFITVDFPPAIKLDGRVVPVSQHRLNAESTKALVYAIMNERLIREFEATKECNFAIAPSGIGRFRCNAFVRMGMVGLVIRVIETKIPTVDDLGLPQSLKKISLIKHGLIIVAGGTGSGKSTTLAAMINHRNEHTHGHIVTVEDPIEFVHQHKNCIVTQREVGVDTENWEVALKNILRQSPDVILFGEIRDRDTMSHGIAFAETGHLALASLHANNANQTMERILNFFPSERRQQLLIDLSLNLRAVIALRLIRKHNGKGRIAAVEILLNTPLVADLIMKGDVHEIKDVMGRSQEAGMKTFDQSLFDLYQAGEITYDEALRNADSINELRLRIKLEGNDPSGKTSLDDLAHLTILEEQHESGMLKTK